VNDRAVEFGYAAAWRLTRALPKRTAYALFQAGADRAARKPGESVQRLADNLRVVVGPDKPEDQFQLLVRAAVRSYARYWCDAFRLPSQTGEQNRTGFVLHGHEVLLENCAAGRGSVLALPHAGNWDAAGAWVAAMGMPITTVAERLKPEGLYERFLAFRQSLGMEILPLTGGPRPAMDVLLERVQAGTVVPLLADRDFSRGGVPVTFFGRRTRMPGGPALLAIRTGAPLYTCDMWYEDRGPVGRVSAPLVLPDPDSGTLTERVAVVTQKIADNFAAGIRRRPEDWHMLAKMFVPEKIPAKATSEA
jgi:phosphatidylinositol dimannoside acyltransferase